MASRSSGRFRESPNPAAVSTRSLSICRGSIAGSASRSCRPRAAFCPTTKPAPPMSAARCCAACSETPGFEVIMSRIGKHPVAIPQGVEVQLSGQTLTVKGRLGALTTTVSGEVAATVENGAVTITPGSETKRARALWGTTRALVNNMVTGVANGCARLSVFRSSRHIYAQIIDDQAGRTLAAASTLDATVKPNLKTGSDTAAASAVGKLLAERAKAAGVDRVVFDRGAYLFHGRIKALADAAREGGLQF